MGLITQFEISNFEMILIRNDLVPLIDGMKLNISTYCKSCRTKGMEAKKKNNKAKSNIVLNLEDAQVKAIKPHTTTKAMWDALKLVYEHLNRA
jgi:UDP-3-O-acyl-N-acetylglucosamine deacetylase